MRFHWLVGAVVVTLLTQISPPARAGLDGSTVQAASYLNVTNPPPAASPAECTVIECTILDYQGLSGPTNSPLPTVPVTYLLDFLTETTVVVDDAQIDITNNLAGPFCDAIPGCVAGNFSGYGFLFTGAPNITNVAVDAASSADFQPVSGGLTWTADSIYVNVNGDNLNVGDQLILHVTTAGSTSTVPEPSAWTVMLLALVGLGLAVRRQKRA
jgi:MYXO-CTERM domain-containing protein